MVRLLEFSEYKALSPKTKTITNWWQLYPTTSIKLNVEYQREIFGDAVNKAGNYSALAKQLHISRKCMSACHRLERLPAVECLAKVLRYLRRDLNEASGRIIEIGGLKKPLLPFNLKSPEGAEITAAFLSDGHLPKLPFKNPMYCANEKELHARLISLCKKIFGEFNGRIKAGHNALLTRFPVPIGIALERAGVPRGDKGIRNPFLPRHIFTGNNKLKSAYLKRAFDDEGDVHISKIKRAIRLTRSVDAGEFHKSEKIKPQRWCYGFSDTPINNLIMGEYLLLRKIGIDARLYPEGLYLSKSGKTTAKWRIQIAQQDNVVRFAEKIGFNHSEKMKKLRRAMNSYLRKKSPDGATERKVDGFIERLSKQKRTITFKDIAKKMVMMGMTYDYAGYFLKKSVDKHKLEKIRRGVYIVIKNN